jgi:hypothetical protein
VAKWVFDQWDNTMEYPTLGFVAEPGDILDATNAPDARWSLNGDQGAAETVERFAAGGSSDFVETTDGYVLTYDAVQNRYVPTDPAGNALLSATFATRAMGIKPFSQLPGSGVQQPVVRSYRPAAFTNKIVSSSAYVAVDAANLAVTFVAPPSGRVVVRLSAGGQTAANSVLTWGLHENGALVPESAKDVLGDTTSAKQHTNVEATLYITKDGSGATLVPGKAYTFTWVQRVSPGTSAYTDYGGGYGPAIMEVRPVSHRLTDVEVTSTIDAAATHLPYWVCDDRTTVLGIDKATQRKVAWSLDEGATWTTHAFAGFPAGLQGIVQAEDGEIIVYAGWGAAAQKNPSVWKSTGWITDKATATFREVLTAEGPDPATNGGSWGSFSMDVYGPLVIAGEYGPKVGPTAMARYLWLSEDSGDTWRKVFDVAAWTTGVGAHLHGACIDPWWDALWVTTGDGAGNHNQFVSLDRGETWHAFNYDRQFTTIAPMPDRIILATDGVGGNGFFEIPRVHPALSKLRRVHTNGTSTVHDQFGTGYYRSRTASDAPLLVSTNPHGAPARIFATHDGLNFKRVFEDTGFTYDGYGIPICVGPTLSGKYLARLNRSASDISVVTLTVA